MNRFNNKAIIISIIFTISAIILTNCGEDKKPVKTEQKVDTGKIISMKADPVEGSFSDIRNKVLNTSPRELGLSIEDGKTLVYGVMMETNVGGNVYSVYTFENGDAGMISGKGEGVLNAAKNPLVAKAAKEFLKNAKNYLDKMKKTNKTTIPEKEIVKFYLITNNGPYLGTAVSLDIENNISPLRYLYDRGADLLAELLKEKPTKL